MGNVTKSQQNNITSPNGNSLAVFVEGTTGVMKVKDVMGNIQPLSDFVGGGGGSSPFEYNANGTGIEPCLGSNNANGAYSTIGGGLCNTASGDYSIIGGGTYNIASGNTSTISGGSTNIACGISSTIGGGSRNTTNCNASTIGGGFCNTANCDSSTIAGGAYNLSCKNASFVGGGCFNSSTGDRTVIGGGFCNTASGNCSIIGGGCSNIASGISSSILGGCNNNTCGFANAMIVGSSLCATQACTTFMNCASVQNLTVGCLVCVGANKVLENLPASSGTLSYGVFSQTANSTPITATTVESSLLGSGIGTLTVPPNGFSNGNSFTANMSGIMSAKNNDTITIRVKSGSVVLAQSAPLTMPNITNQVWNLTIDFTIRTIGGVGVASIATLGQMHILKLASGTQEGFGFNTINTTTFNTTISNTLSVTAEWSSNSALNSIYSDIFVLTKIY